MASKFQGVRILFLLVSIGLAAPGLAQDCVVPPSDMVSWWRAEGDETDFVDGNDGAGNGVGYAAGMVGQAFAFDGVDDAITIPHAVNQNLGTGFTVDAWVKPTSLGLGKVILQKRNVSNVGGFTFETSESQGLQFYIWVDGTYYWCITPSNVLSVGTWRHVAATYDGEEMKVFVDGVERMVSGVLASIDNSTEPLVIGRNVPTPSYVWHGLLDEIHLFRRALSAAEIMSIYQAGAAGICTDVTGVASFGGESSGLVLAQNYPNPFRSDTAVRFELPSSSNVRLDVVDVAGRLVRSLVDGPKPAGAHVVSWDGRDRSGTNAATGVYAVRLQAGGSVLVRKMVVLE